MAIIMADNFTINLEKSLDDRTYFKTKKAMKDFSINKTTVIGANYIFPITSGSIGYCEETGKHYYFAGRKTDGTITMTVPDAKLEDMGYWKELKLGGGGGVEIVNNYSLLPTVTEDTIYYVVNDYTDTTVSPSITHKSGFYLWYDDGVNPKEWKPVVSNSNSYFTTTSPVTNKIGQFELDDEYTEADKVTINEVLNKLLHVNIEPEIVFELVGNDTLLEIGQIIPIVNLRVAFTKIGNGNITNIQFYKNGVELGSSQTFIDGITEYTNNTDRSISSDTTYKVIVTYNFGKGDKTLEKEINVKFVKRSFYGTTQDDSFVLNSDNIRTLSGSKLGIKKGDKFNININSGDVQVIIAYPKEIGDINSIKYIEGMNAEIKDTFTKQIIQVKDLGTTLTDYNVYVYKPINSYSKNATYVATI